MSNGKEILHFQKRWNTLNKKSMLILLSGVLALSAAACGDDKKDNDITISNIGDTVGIVDEISHGESTETESTETRY